MEIVLARRLNKRLIELRASTFGETVGLLLRSGRYSYHCWLGFIDRDKAALVGKPVKLEIARVGLDNLSSVKWRDVPEGKHVQGCLTAQGVFAVINQDIRII